MTTLLPKLTKKPTAEGRKTSVRTTTISYRCTKCGAVWQKLKDITSHTQTCEGKPNE